MIAEAAFTLIHGDFHVEYILIRKLEGKVDDVGATQSGSDEKPAGQEKKKKKKLKTGPRSSKGLVPEFLILDWQMPEVGDPAKDIARMAVFGGLDNYHRNVHEKAILRAWWEALIENGVPEAEYPWDLACLSYRWWCGWQAALVLMGCHISKLFEEHNGAGYRTAVDRFKAVVHFHGDPRLYEERAKLLAKIGKSWPAEGSPEAAVEG